MTIAFAVLALVTAYSAFAGHAAPGLACGILLVCTAIDLEAQCAISSS